MTELIKYRWNATARTTGIARKRDLLHTAILSTDTPTWVTLDGFITTFVIISLVSWQKRNKKPACKSIL